MSTGAEGPGKYSDETAQSLGLIPWEKFPPMRPRKEPYPVLQGIRYELQRVLDEINMDLKTMAFYTDFLFTAESKEFRYNLKREPM